MNHIQTIDDLNTTLKSNGIDISEWGMGTTKSVQNLFAEIVAGEVYLQTKPLLRVIQVVQIIIRRGNSILIEAKQEFGSGQQRFRNIPPSEKMKTKESYIDTAIRCLQEELGLAPQNIEFIRPTYQQKKTIRNSPSYLGLNTRYTFHTVEARVMKDLPDSDFWTMNATYALGDPIRSHHWVWQPQND